jgi:K+/H+ antiporter YhaU regulatory subunit KhtT
MTQNSVNARQYQHREFKKKKKKALEAKVTKENEETRRVNALMQVMPNNRTKHIDTNKSKQQQMTLFF